MAPRRLRFAVFLQCQFALVALAFVAAPAVAAERYVNPVGGDIGACSTAIAPCQSFNYAFRQAQPGDVVVMAGGAYPAQTMLVDPAKTSDADVVFRPAIGARVSVAQLDFGKAYDDVGAAHVTVEGIEVGSWATFKRSVDVTLRNVRIHGGVFAAGARQLAFIGGEWGDPAVTLDAGHPEFTAYNRPGNVVLPDGLLVDGVFIHDIQRTNESVHTNCLHPQAGSNIVIRNNRFRHCDVFSMLFNPDFDITNVTIENNIFEPSTNVRGGGTAHYSFMLDPSTAAIRNVTIRNNTLDDPWTINANAANVNGRVVGNLGDASGCPRSMTHAYNVWVGRAAKCAPSDKTAGSPGWTSDYHLQANSPAIDAGDPKDFPATDAEGKRRFGGKAPDAGALELGQASGTAPSGPEAPWLDIRQRGRVRASGRGRMRVSLQCIGASGEVCRSRVTLLRGRRDRRGRRAVYATARVTLRVRAAPTKVRLKLNRRARQALRKRGRLSIVAVATTGSRRDTASLNLRRPRG
jgi:hypothetical protein